ncbi:MAG: WbqC family protein [Acidimicrobiales bacterium]
MTLLRTAEINETPEPGNDLVFAVHQPNYLPWLGYFSKIAASDVFVFLDTVQFPRGRNFSVRNRVKTANGSVYLTLPVSVPKGSNGRVTYNEVTLADPNWRTKHLKTIELAYKKAPFFNEVFDLYGEAVEGIDPAGRLVDLNLRLIDMVMTYVGIETSTVRLSELDADFGAKSQLIVDIGTSLGATTYMSGTGGGRDYNDEQLLAENAIDLRYSTYQPAEYPQLWGEFERSLSVLDILFNCGRETAGFLEV